MSIQDIQDKIDEQRRRGDVARSWGECLSPQEEVDHWALCRQLTFRSRVLLGPHDAAPQAHPAVWDELLELHRGAEKAFWFYQDTWEECSPHQKKATRATWKKARDIYAKKVAAQVNPAA